MLFKQARLAFLAAALSVTAAADADELTLIARAFIPNAVPDTPGYVVRVPTNSNGTSFAIKSPAPFDSDVCYLTDQRDFSTSVGASTTSRVSASTTLSLFNGPLAQTPTVAETGTTHAVKCTTAANICTDKAPASDIRWGAASETPTQVKIALDVRGANPCVMPDFLVPDIRITGTVSIDKDTGKLAFEGEGSLFPSLEALVVYQGKTLVLWNATASKGVTSIGTMRSLKGSVELPVFDGTWTTNDPASRFTLMIDGANYRIVERAGPATLERSGKLAVVKNGLQTVMRDNDDETLRFLGFSPAIISEINARGPRPSYLTIRRNAAGIEARWAGLLVTKDDKGRFKEMKQPGDGPVKTFQFTKR